MRPDEDNHVGVAPIGAGLVGHVASGVGGVQAPDLPELGLDSRALVVGNHPDHQVRTHIAVVEARLDRDGENDSVGAARSTTAPP